MHLIWVLWISDIASWNSSAERGDNFDVSLGPLVDEFEFEMNLDNFEWLRIICTRYEIKVILVYLEMQNNGKYVW